jgi:translation initiation factor 2 alpha subunit (eIF-2alpha)
MLPTIVDYIIMKFHRNDIPKSNDTTMVSIVDVDRSLTIIRVILLEYDGLDGNIMFANISKKIKAINRFIKNKGDKPFPCSVYDIDGGMPILCPIKSDNELELAVNRYECFLKLEKLTEDLIFQNKHIDPLVIYDKFLWEINGKLSEKQTIRKDQFTYYLEHLVEMFSLSGFDDENISKFIESIVLRITCTDLIVSSSMNILVISSHGLNALNNLLHTLCKGVDTVYYQDAPSYKLTIKGNSEKECRNSLIELSKVIQQSAIDDNVKAIVEYNISNESVKSKIIRLSTINKTGQISAKHINAVNEIKDDQVSVNEDVIQC